jgi:hypothetical protein
VSARRPLHEPLGRRPHCAQPVQELGAAHLRLLPQRILGELNDIVQLAKLAHE